VGHGIDVGRRRPLVAIATQVVRATGIDAHKQHVVDGIGAGGQSGGLGRTNAGTGRYRRAVVVEDMPRDPGRKDGD